MRRGRTAWLAALFVVVVVTVVARAESSTPVRELGDRSAGTSAAAMTAPTTPASASTDPAPRASLVYGLLLLLGVGLLPVALRKPRS
jgi:hypothetical protein